MHRTASAIALGAACAVLSPGILTLSIARTSVAPVALAAAGAARGRTLPPAWIAFRSAWAGIAGYSATVTVFERKGAQAQHVVFDYNFRKPTSATVRVVQGPNAGVTLVWNGGSSMEAHRGSGLIAQLKRKISLHDPLATTIRGSSIDQLSYGAILAHAQRTPGTVSQARGPVIDGISTDAVGLIPTTSASNAGLTREVVVISKTTHFPMRVLGYAGRMLVRRIDYSKVKFER